MKPGRPALEAILESCGLSLGGRQLDALWAYHRLLRDANVRLNLTRIHNFENMALKHYADSLLVLKFLEPPSPTIDMGSGPGLPGVPLAIARPETHFVLAEPRGARAEFLAQVRDALGLRNVEVYAHKVGHDYPGRVRGVITRAVASIPITLSRVAACLEPGGRMMFMKGPDCDAEIAEAAGEDAGLFRLVDDHAYVIPGTTHRRRLVVYERLDAPAPDLAATSAPAGAGREYSGPVRAITSEANESVRHFRDLLTGRGVRKHAQAILAGPRITAEVVDRFPAQVIGWITDDAAEPPGEGPAPWYRLARPLFQDLDVAGTRAPLLLVKAPPLPPWDDDHAWPDGCTLFIPFQDPENVGAVIRSAAAFGVARVVLLKEAAHPFHPRSSRAAGPALFQVPMFQGPSIRELASRQAPLIALDTAGPELEGDPFPAAFGLVVGVEGPGLPEHLRHGPRRRISIVPGVESLNAATAAAVALYAWSRGRPSPTHGPSPPL